MRHLNVACLTYSTAAVDGLQLVLAWPNILYPVVGTLLAMVPAFLPGASGMTLMALALPLTLSWDPVQIVLLFGALVGGATFMGSVTAILFNVPGTRPTPRRCSTAIRMAVRGEATTALACAAMASACGSTIGIFVLIAHAAVRAQHHPGLRAARVPDAGGCGG